MNGEWGGWSKEKERGANGERRNYEAVPNDEESLIKVISYRICQRISRKSRGKIIMLGNCLLKGK